ncbi:hypothetical protein ACFQ48_14240 [Hymenobacter caeli]|uniref:DUF4386 family protein n=1 Tax=Hymenobacter caeli TaxID=2735894 RepID=A0ABX2FUC9_9BACT|nr:hypothetical protein [Hymenobacter caeli]NRT20079.1 hypothetical protein [Hymenobacter caeli]
MLFADTKTGHLLHIIGTALAGQVLTQELAPVNPHVIEVYSHLVIQVLVAVVTIWATIRKTLQKPEAVVKLPAAAVPGANGGALPGASPAPAGQPGEPVLP